uniref:Piezo-type mechanosensitive ion channel component n=1 Tax=Wuchereria bancrofti TaxID=6293 RepID=A0A1I8EHL2_WUCBA
MISQVGRIINNDYNLPEITVFVVGWLTYGCDQMAESLIHFTLRCVIYVITVVIFVKLPSSCSTLMRDFGRILLITCIRLSDISCSLLLAFCAIHRVSPAALPVLFVAVLLFIPLPANIKRIACFLITYYVLAVTMFKLIFDAYEGFIDYPDFCDTHLIKWLYWIGLISDNTKPALAPVVCTCTLTARSSLQHIKKMYAVRYKKALPILPFPDVDCTNADRGTIYFIKFYANFIVYKFGYELYMIFVLLSAVVASNIISLLSVTILVICLLMDRWRIRRIFLIFVCYHLVVLVYSLLAYIGPVPGKCYYEIPIHPYFAPYFAFINNGQYPASSQRKSSYAIYCYFLNVGVSIMQYCNFKIERVEGDGASGGSNDGILLALHRNESLECNPAPHFFSAHVKVLDELKQCVCSYYHWVVLLLVLSDGIRLSSPVFLSAVLIILAFINLWRGADLYLSHPSVFIRKWRLITIYLLAAVFLPPYGELSTDSLLFDVLTFAALLLQLRLISSWHFQRTVIDTRADRIVCYRGVVLQTQLIYKAMTYHQQQDYRRLAKIKRTVGAMANLNLPFGEWFIECEFYHKYCPATVIVSTFVQTEWTNSEGYDDLKIDTIRGWNENLLHAVDSATENIEEATSTSEIKTGQDGGMKGSKKTQTPYITISALLSTCALWMARKTLSYRYIRFVINEEKRLLLEKLPKELTLASQNSLGKLEKCNLGNEICLVTSSRDIVKYMNEVHHRWLKLPLLWRLMDAIGTFWICNTALLCYLVIIVSHGQSACLLTFPLTMLVFFWGAITERKRRLLWTIAIFYVQIMILVSVCFKYTSLPWVCKEWMKCGRWSMAMVGRFVALLDILRLRQRSPSNYYPWMILSDLLALITMIVNFSNFDLARRDAFTLLESKSSLLPDTFVYYFMTSLGMIILDRIIYLKRAIRVKFLYLVVEVIGIHIYILIILLISPQIDENRRMTVGLFIWYIARGIHMLSSAFQVRDGYPKFIVGDVMMKSNPVSWALYVGYFYTVPVFEIATILDWTFTSTTLTLLDFYILKTINYYLYFIKGMRKLEAMFVGIFLPVQMVFTLRIDKQPILYECHLEDLPLISDQEYNYLIKYFAFDIYAQNFIKSLGAETIVKATLSSRGMIYYAHRDWKDQLIQLANESINGLKLKSRIYLRRMRIQEQTDNLLKKTDTTPLETAREWEMEMEQQELEHLSNVLKSANCSDVFEMDISEIVRPLITVPNGDLMYENPTIAEEQFNHRFAYFNYSFKYMTKLVLKPDCTTRLEGGSVSHVVTLEQYGVSHDGSTIGTMEAPRFFFFVSKVSSSYLRLLNISTPSLVMTFAMVYLLSFKLRDILMTKPFELTFRELGDPSRLIRLCTSISIAREAKLYDLEHDLYGKLIYILRSSEALIQPMKRIFRERSARNSCSNCQIMQFKIEILNAKVGNAKRSIKVFARTTDRSLEKEFKQLREDALSQESAFQSEIEQYQNEKDKLGEQLHDVEHKIVDLNAALQKNCNEGVELLAVKQNVEKRFKEKLEKQKREVENAVRGRMEEIKRQCHLTALEIVQYELMLKKAHEENMELCYRFYKVDNSLQSVKFATEEPANFQSQLKEKLGALVKKFRNEANNSKKKMMMYVLNNFEAAVKVILSDEPHFCYLIKSGIALAFAGNEEINEKSKITIANSGRKEKSDRKEKKKALMMWVLNAVP